MCSEPSEEEQNTDPEILDVAEWEFMEENFGVRNLVGYKFTNI
jgi:hypothetical protein